MLVFTPEPIRAISTQPTRQIWSAIAGLCAGALTAFGLLVIAPNNAITALGLFIRALVYSSAVFVIACGTTLFSLQVGTPSAGIRSPLALRTALTALWLAPLAAISHQKSWFALVLWIVFCGELARLTAFLRKALDSSPAMHHQFAEQLLMIESPNWKPALLSIAGAFLWQTAVVAVIASHAIIAAFLGILSTIMLVWRGVWMIEDSPPATTRNSEPQTLYIFAIATWLIVFSWLPYTLAHGEGGPIASIWNFFAPDHSRYTKVSTPQPADTKKETGGDSPFIHDSVFPGVILYPELKPRTILVAPPPEVMSGSGTEHSDPFSIPFNGVYWLWRPPGEQPPSTAVLKYGSPSAVSFHSTDGSPLWMEAHQNLVKAIRLNCCKAIQVVIDDADSRRDGVMVELMLGNTTVAGKPFVSLGSQDVSEGISPKLTAPVSIILTFRIPDQMKLGKFDQLKVSFRLEWWRGDKSAKIAINRFVLVPEHQGSVQFAKSDSYQGSAFRPAAWKTQMIRL
jgi:hypothetical protein